MAMAHIPTGVWARVSIINIMSLDLLISIMEHPQVYNVYFTAAAPGPGKGLTGISMNYRVYVKYHKVQD